MMKHEVWLEKLAQNPEDDDLRSEYASWLKGRDDPRGDFLEIDASLHATPREAADYAALTEQLEKAGLGLDPAWITRVGERDTARFNLVLRRQAAGRLEALFGINSSDAALKLYRTAFEGGSPLLELGLRKIDALALARTLQHPKLSAEEPSAELVEHRELSELLALRWLLPPPWITVVNQPRFNKRWRERAPLTQIAELSDEPAENGHLATLQAGDPGLVMLAANPSHLVISRYEPGWVQPSENIAARREHGRLAWSALPTDVGERLELLEEAVDGAMMERRRNFRRCHQCGEVKPPEWFDREELCKACAENHLVP